MARVATHCVAVACREDGKLRALVTFTLYGDETRVVGDAVGLREFNQILLPAVEATGRVPEDGLAFMVAFDRYAAERYAPGSARFYGAPEYVRVRWPEAASASPQLASSR